MKTQPAKGMRDFLPEEKRKREIVLQVIKKTYSSFGYTEIETPALESIENLDKSDGGENLSMLFRVMRRGLDWSKEILPEKAIDLGLRYDLTLPLVRYYVANKAKLPEVFRSIQIGPVWRAEKPQKGRFRQFIQCDIDAIGLDDYRCEIELIAVTSMALKKLEVTEFTVSVNDRRILSSLLKACGFDESQYPLVFICLDKFDKIGFSGVSEELFKKIPNNVNAVELLVEALEEFTQCRSANKLLQNVSKRSNLKHDSEAIINLQKIIEGVKKILPDASIVYNPTLVRGMGYYTGTIFEINVGSSGSSIAGGGRYDDLIGKFSKYSIPACGFSVGFERIIDLVPDSLCTDQSRLVLFYQKDQPYTDVLVAQMSLVGRGYVVEIAKYPRKLNKTIQAYKVRGFNSYMVLDSSCEVNDSCIKTMN